jgi:hypothetical protein
MVEPDAPLGLPIRPRFREGRIRGSPDRHVRHTSRSSVSEHEDALERRSPSLARDDAVELVLRVVVAAHGDVLPTLL